MINFNYLAREIFEILRSYSFAQVLYDGDGNRTDSPDDARRFFVKAKNLLVSINEDEDRSSVKFYIGQDEPLSNLSTLITTLRTTASKFKLLFNVRSYGHEITPKDFAGNMNESKDIFEGLYGTSKKSYLKLDNSRMIVSHPNRVIESILFEIGGNLFKFGSSNLAPAKAMAQHFNHGGEFADMVGQQINRMANDFSSLSSSFNAMDNMEPAVEAPALAVVQEACRARLNELMRIFERLADAATYITESMAIVQLNEEEIVPEDRLEQMGGLLTALKAEKTYRISDTVNDEKLRGKYVKFVQYVTNKDHKKQAEVILNDNGREETLRLNPFNLVIETVQFTKPMIEAICKAMTKHSKPINETKLLSLADRLLTEHSDWVNSLDLTQVVEEFELLDELTGDNSDVADTADAIADIGSEDFDPENNFEDESDFGGNVPVIDHDDILLPDGNQNDDFILNVVSKTETDPLSGEAEDTGGAYLDRLKALAGMTSATEFNSGIE